MNITAVLSILISTLVTLEIAHAAAPTGCTAEDLALSERVFATAERDLKAKSIHENAFIHAKLKRLEVQYCAQKLMALDEQV